MRLKDRKTTTKPWGHEELVEVNDSFAIKEIFLRAGTRSSLQSHSLKKETILVLSGALELEIVDSNGKTFKELYQKNEAYHIPPKTKHRVEAIEDSLVIEVSTPELDDVIRYEDDFGRAGK